MLPDVDDEQRLDDPLAEILVLFGAENLEALRHAVFHEQCPARAFDGAGYGDLKTAVGESVVELLTPVRETFEALRADERELQRLLGIGADKARRAAEPTLEAIYDRMGFVRPEAGRLFGAARPRGL